MFMFFGVFFFFVLMFVCLLVRCFVSVSAGNCDSQFRSNTTPQTLTEKTKNTTTKKNTPCLLTLDNVMLPPQCCLTTNSETRPVVLVVVGPRHKQPRSVSIAFRHLPANSARIGYVTKGAFFISAQLSTDAVGVLRNVWVLLKSNAKDWPV